MSQYGDGLASQILKVAHHGSSTSSTKEFLDKVRPKAAYIEVGSDNTYNHPNPGTVARLQSIGATIHRTGTQLISLGLPVQSGSALEP